MKTKSTSQTPRTLTRNAILLAITVLALCASPGARADEVCTPGLDTSWTNTGTDDWFQSSNWCNGVPICHSRTCISNGGTAQISSADPVANARETFLGQNACSEGCSNSGQSGNLSVNGGTLTTCNELHVGYAGTGKLTINSGGHVSTTFAADIGAVAGSNGSASVDGTNSQWTINGGGVLYVAGTINGQGGTGLLTVTNSATVTAGSMHVYKSGTLTGTGTINMGSTGTATVDGTVSRSSGTLTITGNLSLTTSAATQCGVTPQDNPNQADILVSGAATLNGRLSVTMTGTFTCGTTYILLHAGGGITPNTQFSSVSINFPTGQGWQPVIVYDTNNVKLNLACTTGP